MTKLYKRNFGNGAYQYTLGRTGPLHREDGPAVRSTDGAEFWYKFGRFHRIDGPAVTNGEYFAYYRYGLLHREDGPALIKKDGTQPEWYLFGERIPKKKFTKKFVNMIVIAHTDL